MVARMTRTRLIELLRGYKFAVQATVSPTGAPQASVVGFAVTDDLELVFDTLGATRKATNLRAKPRMALVVWEEGYTIQLEGLADEPTGAELDRLKRVYFARFPDGPERQSWPGMTYVRVRPTWVRASDFRKTPPEIVELDPSQA